MNIAFKLTVVILAILAIVGGATSSASIWTTRGDRK